MSQALTEVAGRVCARLHCGLLRIAHLSSRGSLRVVTASLCNMPTDVRARTRRANKNNHYFPRKWSCIHMQKHSCGVALYKQATFAEAVASPSQPFTPSEGGCTAATEISHQKSCWTKTAATRKRFLHQKRLAEVLFVLHYLCIVGAQKGSSFRRGCFLSVQSSLHLGMYVVGKGASAGQGPNRGR